MIVHFTVGAVRSASAAVVVGSYSPPAAAFAMATASFLMLGVKSRLGGRSGVCVCCCGARGGCHDRACGFVSSVGI